MSSLARTYSDNLETGALTAPRERTGGPRRADTDRYDKSVLSRKDDHIGSHMPLDTDIHWDWLNPLNILPAFVLFVIALALVAAVLS
jgi:hypothetical protein